MTQMNGISGGKAGSAGDANWWRDFVVVGVTGTGEFQVVCSEMTAERALWLIEWGKCWAMGGFGETTNGQDEDRDDESLE